jgi:arylformamidase
MPDARVIDISVMLSPETPVWPGDTAFSCLWTWSMVDGSSVNVSSITVSPHAGTHADTPLHITHGAAGSESLPLHAFRGPAVVVDVSDLDDDIQLGDIDRRTSGLTVTRMLLRTGRSIASGTFPERWPSLSAACARELVRRGVVLVGFDCPSADDVDSKTLHVHHALLDNGACVLENLDLRNVSAGEYFLDALPVKIAGLDAAPVRAVLLRNPVPPA